MTLYKYFQLTVTICFLSISGTSHASTPGDAPLKAAELEESVHQLLGQFIDHQTTSHGRGDVTELELEVLFQRFLVWQAIRSKN